jgi:hypothetical protein
MMIFSLVHSVVPQKCEASFASAIREWHRTMKKSNAVAAIQHTTARALMAVFIFYLAFYRYSHIAIGVACHKSNMFDLHPKKGSFSAIKGENCNYRNFLSLF